MKITKTQLKKLIKEELEAVLGEITRPKSLWLRMTDDVADELYMAKKLDGLHVLMPEMSRRWAEGAVGIITRTENAWVEYGRLQVSPLGQPESYQWDPSKLRWNPDDVPEIGKGITQ